MNSRILPGAMVGHVSGLASVAHRSFSDFSSSLFSFDRVSSADQERSEEFFGNVRKGFGEIRNV